MLQTVSVKVAVGETGRRVGESHPNVRYTDGEVALVIALREDGMTLGQIAKRMEMPKSTVRDICSGRRRAVPVVIWRRVTKTIVVAESDPA